jgi:hypothetical protein
MNVANLAAALVAFQADMPTVKKAQKAVVPTKSGGSYSYTYAGLADVVRVAMPLLTQHGLAFTALPRFKEGRYELVGTLLHSSGESIKGTLPINGSTPQEMGSSITYMRRYLFGCLTGLVTDDDDDGAVATRAARNRSSGTNPPVEGVAGESGHSPAKPPRATKPVQAAIRGAQSATQKAQAETGELMSANTRGRLFALFGEHGYTDRDQQLAGINNHIGRTITSRSELTEQEAQRIIGVLATRPRPNQQEQP